MISRRSWSPFTPYCTPLRHPGLIVTCLTGFVGLPAHFSVAASSEPVDLERLTGKLLPAVLISEQPTPTRSLSTMMQQLGVTGISIAVFKNARIIAKKSTGVVTHNGRAIDSQTLFQAGSISKPVAAVATMQLAQAGFVDLDHDVNTYLKEWKLPTNEFTSTEKVTLRRIMSHTAGMTVHGFWGYPEGAAIPDTVSVLDGQPPANSPPIRVDVEPGSIWRYSGGGYTVIQKLLEDVTGAAFPDLLQDKVLQPARMNRSTFSAIQLNQSETNIAQPHDETGVLIEGGPRVHPEYAAAALWTTASDLAHFAMAIALSANANNEATLLSPETTAEMLTPVSPGEWSLGFQVGGAEETPYFWHSGGTRGYRSLLVSYQHGDGVAILTNGSHGDQIAASVLRTLASHYEWESFKPRSLKVIELTEDQIRPFAGSYQLPSGTVITFSVLDGKLIAEDPYHGRVVVLAEGAQHFFWPNHDTQAEFQSSTAGHVKQVAITINGTKMLGELIQIDD